MCFIMSQGFRLARRERLTPKIFRNAESESEATSIPEQDNFVANGFDHPKLKVILKDGIMDDMYWGLIPIHTRSRDEAKSSWDRYTIARGETMFDLYPYKHAATNFRCIVPLTGYFEHQHLGRKKLPHLIYPKNGEIFYVGAIYSIWTAPETVKTVKTFAVVTTTPTDFIRTVHNKPRNGESRMPLILEQADLETWFGGSAEEVAELVKANKFIDLISHTVAPLTGKDSLGNTAQALQQKIYSNISDFFGKD